jgi:hypothetical protein
LEFYYSTLRALRDLRGEIPLPSLVAASLRWDFRVEMSVHTLVAAPPRCAKLTVKEDFFSRGAPSTSWNEKPENKRSSRI